MPVTNHAEEMLRHGAALLAPLLLKHGFIFKTLDTGISSGGHFASGKFKRGTRRLEFHFRQSLGIVTYHLADRTTYVVSRRRWPAACHAHEGYQTL